MRRFMLISLFTCLMLIMTISVGYADIDPTTIMGMWLMDEGSGDMVKDSSGNNNDGTIVGAEWVDGKIGKGLEFNGASHVAIPASETTDDIQNGFTYMIWVMPTGDQPNDNTRVIERDWHNPTIQIGPADFYGSIAVNADQSSTNVRGGAWAMNEWSFVALTYDGNMIHLYVDGEMVNEKEVGKPDTDYLGGEGAIWLGSWKAAGWNYVGVLDEAAVFNVALSEDDINAIMNGGLLGVSAVSPTGKLATTWSEVKTSR
jgi:hypothetical protein